MNRGSHGRRGAAVMQISDSIVVVTGASSGIGRATALAFAEAGASAVVLVARGSEALTQAARECAQRGAEAVVVPADVTDATALDDLAQRTIERFGRLDVWVNNAAVSLFGSIQQTPLRDIRRVVDVNLMGYVHGARAALPFMRAQGRGVLVNVASTVGVVAQPYASAYVMAKFAIRGLSASLRQELRLADSRGVHVCTVLPATIDTPLFAHAANYSGRRVLAMPPVYRPERVARAIVNAVRVPRREIVVGPAGRVFVLQSRMMPGMLERTVARRVDKRHLSRTEVAPATEGNLYGPDTVAAATRGGWRGPSRATAGRLAASVVLTAAAVAALRRFRP